MCSIIKYFSIRMTYTFCSNNFLNPGKESWIWSSLSLNSAAESGYSGGASIGSGALLTFDGEPCFFCELSFSWSGGVSGLSRTSKMSSRWIPGY